MSDFKEIPLKRARRIEIPYQLLPTMPADPKIGSPAWLTVMPRLFKLKTGLAITRDMTAWRDRYGAIWTCPRGFLTDGASVPWALRWLWAKWDERTLRSAVMHDLRYCLQDYFKNWPFYDTQKAADLSLLDGMKADCPRRAHLYFIAVRLVGRAVYEYINEEKLMLEWFDVLRLSSELALDVWITDVIEKDKMA